MAVLNVLRSQWRRADSACQLSEQRLAKWFRQRVLNDLPWAVVAVALVRLLCVVTYPPNLGGDAAGYLKMVRRWQSNLILPGGYPWLVGALAYLLLAAALAALVRHWRRWRTSHWVALAAACCLAAGLLQMPIAAGSPVVKRITILQQYWIVLVQHLVVVAGLLLAHRTIAAIWSRRAASLSVLIYGLHPLSLSTPSTFYASWLQGLALCTTLCLLYWAFVAELPLAKLRSYCLAAVAFACCFLIKPNSLVFAVVFPVVIGFETLGAKQKLSFLFAAGGSAAATCLTYVLCFHYPSTGTIALTHDKAWILLHKTESFVPQRRLHPEAGLNTKRLLYLNRVLPWGGMANLCVRPIDHLHDVSPEIRQPYREQFLDVLSADEPTLDRLLAETRPREDFDFYTAFCPTFSYLGVAEGDKLGTAVFVEQLAAFPRHYAAAVWQDASQIVLHGLPRAAPDASQAGPLLPLLPLEFSASEKHALGGGLFYWQQPKESHPAPAFYAIPVVWSPGVKFFRSLALAYDMLFRYELVLGLVVLGCVFSLWKIAAQRTFRLASTSYLLLAASIPLFVLFSVMLFQFRWKEFHLVLPMISTLLAVSYAMAWDCVEAVISAWRAPRPQRSKVQAA